MPTGATGILRSSTSRQETRKFEEECVDFFAETVQVFGVPRSVGQIYGLLFATPDPLSFSDIVERLEISKGSASQGLHLLRTLGAVFLAEQLPGGSSERQLGLAVSESSRREYYSPELQLRKLVSGVIGERLGPLTSTGKLRLRRLREIAESGNLGSGFKLDRVRQLETWRRRSMAVLPVLNALLGPRTKK